MPNDRFFLQPTSAVQCFAHRLLYIYSNKHWRLDDTSFGHQSQIYLLSVSTVNMINAGIPSSNAICCLLFTWAAAATWWNIPNLSVLHVHRWVRTRWKLGYGLLVKLCWNWFHNKLIIIYCCCLLFGCQQSEHAISATCCFGGWIQCRPTLGGNLEKKRGHMWNLSADSRRVEKTV